MTEDGIERLVLEVLRPIQVLAMRRLQPGKLRWHAIRFDVVHGRSGRGLGRTRATRDPVLLPRLRAGKVYQPAASDRVTRSVRLEGADAIAGQVFQVDVERIVQPQLHRLAFLLHRDGVVCDAAPDIL